MNIKNWTRTVSKGFYSVTEVAAWIGYIAARGHCIDCFCRCLRTLFFK